MHKLSPLAREKRTRVFGTWKDRHEENEEECGRSKRWKIVNEGVEGHRWEQRNKIKRDVIITMFCNSYVLYTSTSPAVRLKYTFIDTNTVRLYQSGPPKNG